jgi:peptide/nickel transport system substrate-binding protein
MTEERPPEHFVAGELTRQDLLRRTGGAAVGAGLMLGPTGAALAKLAAQPKRGGTLLVGFSAGSAKDTVDPHLPLTPLDQFRESLLYEGLATFDANFVRKLVLAEELTLERGDRLLVRLRPGVEFHDGKPLTVDDLLFSYRRILSQTRAVGRAGLSIIDMNRSKKLDKRTVRFFLKEPNVAIMDEVANVFNGIAPVGFDPRKPNGTGPFMFKSLDPGRRSVFDRNPHYWQNGLPYVDSVVINDLTDNTARLNALLGGQVHVIDSLPATQAAAVKGRSDLRLVLSKSGQWAPFMMRVDAAPFDDVRVRQALRLVVDRPQMIRQAYAGYGAIGNDVPSPQDPDSTHRLPQRHQDIEKARSLLKQAGQENLKVTLVTGPALPGMIESAQVLVEQAKKAGVTINLQQVDTGTLFGPNFLKWTFSGSWWSTRNYLPTVALAMLPISPYNETHWPDPQSRVRYSRLYKEAKAQVDTAKRRELIHEMQKIEYERGGYLIWGFETFIDAHSTKISGLRPHRYKPLNGYNLSRVYFV